MKIRTLKQLNTDTLAGWPSNQLIPPGVVGFVPHADGMRMCATGEAEEVDDAPLHNSQGRTPYGNAFTSSDKPKGPTTLEDARKAASAAGESKNRMGDKVQAHDDKIAELSERIQDSATSDKDRDDAIMERITMTGRRDAFRAEHVRLTAEHDASVAELKKHQRKADLDEAMKLHNETPADCEALRTKMLDVLRREILPDASRIAAKGRRRDELRLAAGEMAIGMYTSAAEIVAGLSREFSIPGLAAAQLHDVIAKAK
ncbi:MAG TPA: hypothetical protein VFV19_02995 [Candidatus Polarisedimenticolaceae bacterium]|nr:hypothetical protein [Candidatus Polarisedimenticolaceae bacterium]